MTVGYVIGYDPGGNGRHGLAALHVEEREGRWEPRHLLLATGDTLNEVVAWVDRTSGKARIVAAGVDTLTEWNSGRSALRPADVWLRRHYRDVARGIITPAALRGAMVVNGGGFLIRLTNRFQADRTVVTEAHPKVCYRAITGHKADWEVDCEAMAAWLVSEFGIARAEEIAVADDHRFDAATAALAALRGLNGDWTLDLHALPDADYSGRIRFCGLTHYWWPDPPAQP